MSDARILAVCLLVASVAGCAAPAGDGIVATRESHEGSAIVAQGGMSILEGALYEMDGGTLQLGTDDGVIVDGVLDVRGTLVLRGVHIRGLLRLVSHPGSTLLLDNVSLEGGPAWPTLVLRSDGARITGSRLDVHRLDILGTAHLEGNTIRADSESPAVLWRDGHVTMRGNTLTAPGHGILLGGATGDIEANLVRSEGRGAGVTLAAIGSTLAVRANTLEGGDVGLAFTRGGGEVLDNDVRGTRTAGIVLTQSRALLAGNRLDSPGRAGIVLDEQPPGAVVSGNRVSGAAGPASLPGAGLVVRDSATRIADNVVTGNDVGVLVLSGAPTLHGNTFGGNRLFGILRNVSAAPGTPPLDASGNWWGAPTGPVPAAGAPADEPTLRVPGADRVGPGVRYAPWTLQAGPAATPSR